MEIIEIGLLHLLTKAPLALLSWLDAGYLELSVEETLQLVDLVEVDIMLKSVNTRTHLHKKLQNQCGIRDIIDKTMCINPLSLTGTIQFQTNI